MTDFDSGAYRFIVGIVTPLLNISTKREWRGAEHVPAQGPCIIVPNHTSYFDPGSTSLDNLTAIVQGYEPTVVGGRTEDANDLALDWAKDEAGYQVGRGVDSGRTWVEERWEDFSDLWR